MFLDKILPLFQTGKIKEGITLSEQENVVDFIEDRYQEFYTLLAIEGDFAQKITTLFTGYDFNLSYKKIKKLSPIIGDFIHVTTLDLSNNQLSKLPLEANQLIHLKTLNLSHNRFGKFSRVLLSFNNLTELDLSHNQFANFPIIPNAFQHLKVINISHNKLNEYPILLESEQLNIIDISANQFAVSPPFFKTLSQLKELIISTNSFNDLPSSIFNQPALEYFEATEMDLTTYGKLNGTLLRTFEQNGGKIVMDDENWRYQTDEQTQTYHEEIDNSLKEKQAIDNELLKIVKATKCTIQEYNSIKQLLDKLQPEKSLDYYLKEQAIHALAFFFTREDIEEFVSEKLKSAHYIDFLTVNDPRMHLDFDDENIDYYPNVAHEFLEQCDFISMSGSDVVGRWTTSSGMTYCHAHTEGFWTLAESAFEFIQKITTKIEKK